MSYPIEALYGDTAQVQHSTQDMFGSGRLIGRNLVLTARHVVAAEGAATPLKDGWQVRFLSCLSDAARSTNQSWIDASVIWAGEGTLDLALLELHPEAGTTDRYPKLRLRISQIDEVQHHRVRGLGFPRGAKVDNRRMLFVPSGDLDDEKGVTLCFGIDQAYQPESPDEDWRGFSGGAVLLEESSDPEVVWIYGVAQQVPRSFNRRLDVSRLARAWADEGFRSILEAAGIPVAAPVDPLAVLTLSNEPVIQEIRDLSADEDAIWSALDLYSKRLPPDERYDVDVFFNMIKHHLAGDFGPRRKSDYWRAYLFLARYGKEVVGMLLGYNYDDAQRNFLYIPYLVAWKPPKNQRNPVDISRLLVRALARVQRESEAKERPAKFLTEVDDPSESSDPKEQSRRRNRIELFTKIAAFSKIQLRCIDFKFLQPKLEPWSKQQEKQLRLLYGAEHLPSSLSRAELLDIITWLYTQLYAANISDDPAEGQEYERYLRELLDRATEKLPDEARLLRLQEI